jgi:hypothetical protein
MAEPGYGLTVTSLRRIRRLLWKSEKTADKLPPAIRQYAAYGDTFPHRLAKPSSGESFDGSTPTVSTPCDIYAGDPGSEVVVEEGIPVYQGRQLESSETIADTEWVIVGEVNGVLQLVSPRTTGGGSSSAGGMIVVELPSDLAKTDATKASCTVKQTFSGGPSVASTVTITNPDALGGNYQFRAESTTQYVNCTWQGGSTYLIHSVQPVAFDPVDDVTWSSPDLDQVKRDIDIGYLGSTATTTVLTGNTECAPP